MSVILLLIAISLAIALFFLASFIWAVRSGQFDDTCTPSLRMLADDERSIRAVPDSETKPTSKSP
jgi:cbb3-type cytochrome oxidase maturation protein